MNRRRRMASNKLGYWGPSTSTMDFCEPNHVHSHYIAEFWNTLSSLPMITTGLLGVRLCRQQRLGHEQMLSYAALAVIGVGSVCFHATLLRTGQVLDELPMLWAVLLLMYVALSTRHERRWRWRRRAAAAASRAPPLPTRLVAVRCALAAYGLAASGLYFASGFVAFILAFGASVVLLIGLAFSSMISGGVEVPPAGPLPQKMLTAAAALYAGGVLLLWLPGELLCGHVPLLQRLPLHSLYHLTATAAPHLGLTAFALARFEHEQPAAPRSLAFGGLPAIDRGAAAIDKAV